MEENNKQQLEQDMQESVNEETKEQGNSASQFHHYASGRSLSFVYRV